MLIPSLSSPHPLLFLFRPKWQMRSRQRKRLMPPEVSTSLLPPVPNSCSSAPLTWPTSTPCTSTPSSGTYPSSSTPLPQLRDLVRFRQLCMPSSSYISWFAILFLFVCLSQPTAHVYMITPLHCHNHLSLVFKLPDQSRVYLALERDSSTGPIMVLKPGNDTMVTMAIN